MLRACEIRAPSALDRRIIKAIGSRRRLRIQTGLDEARGDVSAVRLALVPGRRCYWDRAVLMTWDCDCRHCFPADGDDEGGVCQSTRPFAKAARWPPAKSRSLLTYTENPCTLDQLRALYSEEDRAQFKGPDQRTAKERAVDKRQRQKQRKKDGRKKGEGGEGGAGRSGR